MQELGLLGVILLMWAFLSYFGHRNAEPGSRNIFLNADNFVDQIASSMSYYAIMAAGAVMVIISGGIDLSVGAVMAISALAAGAVLPMFPASAPAWQVLPVALVVGGGVGLLCGLINGCLIVGLRLHPFIVTLGTLSIFRGIAVVAPQIAHMPATLPPADKSLPPAFYDNFMHAKIYGERVMPMIVMLMVIAIAWFYLSKTVGGREIYAVGGNEEAARFSGLRVGAIKIRIYAIAGLAAGIAGLVSLGKFGAVSTGTGEGYELTVIASAVVGGASLSGGRGGAIGALLGALVIATIENGINIMHWPQEYRKIIIGGAIIVAVAIDRFSEHLRSRRHRGAGAK
jgi:ribose/xylose/arabinose/galactoside ABC-type transport system permease subunit